MAEPMDPPQKHLDCIDVVELVSDYLEGAHDPETRAALEQHFLLCRGCMTYLDQIRRAVEAARELGTEPSPPPEALRELFRQWRTRNG